MAAANGVPRFSQPSMNPQDSFNDVTNEDSDEEMDLISRIVTVSRKTFLVAGEPSTPVILWAGDLRKGWEWWINGEWG